MFNKKLVIIVIGLFMIAGAAWWLQATPRPASPAVSVANQVSAGTSTLDLIPPAPAPSNSLTPFVSNALGNRDRSVVFDATTTFTIQSGGVRLDPLPFGAKAISIGIWEVTPGGGYLNLGTRAATPLQTATVSISDIGLAFYDVPISFTFQAGHRYSVGFSQTAPSVGWGTNTNMEFYHFGAGQAHDPPYRDNKPFAVGGAITVLNGGYGADLSQDSLPHIRLSLLPPDPGEAGKATLAGIDSDGDGVRDDVERYIVLNVPDSARHREALKQEAKAIQLAILAQTKDESLSASQARRSAIDCIFYLGKGEKGAEWKQVLALMLNTPARIHADDAHQDRINGSVFTMRTKSQWIEGCSFNVSNFAN